MSALVGTTTIKVVIELILNGQIRQARERCDKLVSNNAWFMIEDANFFYWYAKAVRLTNHDEKLLAKIKIFMQDCKNYTRLLSCDWLIDEAIDAIRLFKPDLADEVLRYLIYELPVNPSNHYYVTISMIRGRIAYWRRDFSQAIQHLVMVNVFSQDEYEYEYRMKNLLYLLKASSAKNGRSNIYRDQIIKKMIGGGIRRLQHFRVKLISSCRLGNTIDDILMRLGLV